MKQPSKNHPYAIGHDMFGNTFVAIKVGRHMDYIYGMFKGKELLGGHLDESKFVSWHKEHEHVVFVGHPHQGNIVLVMGEPGIGDVREITGPEADAAVAAEAAAEAIPTVKLASGREVPQYMLCRKCGAHLHISPNIKGAFSYQGCDCHEPR